MKIFTLTNDNHQLNNLPEYCCQVYAGDLDINKWGYLSALHEVVKMGRDADVIGVTTDGRLFCAQTKAEEWEMSIKRFLSEADMIVEPVNTFESERVSAQFARCHIPSCMFYVYEAICNTYPHYENDFFRVMDGRKLHLHNTFITKGYVFDDYMKWLFDIVFYVAKMLKGTPQNYILASLPERLMEVYIQHNGLVVKEISCIRIK